MEPTHELVYIVDDEASVGEALPTLLRANGKRVQLFTSGMDFLDVARRDTCGCLILDLNGRSFWREVLLNKQAAFELWITEYTVQIHCGHIMRKMEADSFASLIKLANGLMLETASASNGSTV